ncbi:MAG: CPBP family intramembrane metalloprotease [Candidatus Omnitrophica bacterium]|jgi:membrane protease YdiL (CAAX protease family)|nr:CPBP family intramembrane metalloprotease [Candidatus Omnitrophota bacterium]
MKKYSYLVLSILFLLTVVFLQIFFRPTQPADNLGLQLDINKLMLKSSSPLFIVLSLIYLIIFVSGIANLSIFLIKKISGKSIVDILSESKKIDLSFEKASRLLFFITASILIAYLLTGLVYFIKIYETKVNLILSVNMLLQIAIIIFILKDIKLSDLGLHFNKKPLILALRIYSASLPIVFLALILNNLLAKILKLSYSSGPAVELFFALDNKISVLILAAQIILFGPIAEELFFRGFIYKITRNRYSFLVSTALTSLVFSLAHQAFYNILGLFLLSAALCYLYEKTQNIMAPIVFHTTHNLINISFLLLFKT